MGLRERLGYPPYDEPDFDGMPDPEPPDPHAPWDEPQLEQDPNDPNHWTWTSPAPDPLFSVQLKREPLQGRYGWTISFSGSDMLRVLAEVREADIHLRRDFGGQS